MAADIEKLVADKFLDLGELMEGKWLENHTIIEQRRKNMYTRRVIVQRAESHGIVAWRWVDCTNAAILDYGLPTLDRIGCVLVAREHVERTREFWK